MTAIPEARKAQMAQNIANTIEAVRDWDYIFDKVSKESGVPKDRAIALALVNMLNGACVTLATLAVQNQGGLLGAQTAYGRARSHV